METRINFVVKIKISTLPGAEQSVLVLARTAYEAIDIVYERKGFKHREPDRKNYRAIKPMLRLS